MSSAHAEVATQLKVLSKELGTTETLEALQRAAVQGAAQHQQQLWFFKFTAWIEKNSEDSVMTTWARGTESWYLVTTMRSAISRSMERFPHEADQAKARARLDTIDSALDHALKDVDRFKLYASCQ